jgi:hypothetical protein
MAPARSLISWGRGLDFIHACGPSSNGSTIAEHFHDVEAVICDEELTFAPVHVHSGVRECFPGKNARHTTNKRFESFVLPEIERRRRPQTVSAKETQANLGAFVVECDEEYEMATLTSGEKTSSVGASLSD